MTPMSHTSMSSPPVRVNPSAASKTADADTRMVREHHVSTTLRYSLCRGVIEHSSSLSHDESRR